MRKDKEEALQLRQQGKSYKEIRKELGVPLATLSDWLRDEDWSQEIRGVLTLNNSLAITKNKTSAQKANIKRRTQERSQYRERALLAYPDKKDSPLFIAGLMLYWAQGDTSPKESRVHFSSGDPEVINVFYQFLLKQAKIDPERIKLRLILYPDLIDSVQKNLWSKLLGIEPERFAKSINLKNSPGKSRRSFGTCTVEVYSRELKETLLEWLTLIKKGL